MNRTNPPRGEEAKYVSNACEAAIRHERRAHSTERSRPRSRNRTNPPRGEEAKYVSNTAEAENRHEKRADSTDRSRQRSRSRSMDRTPVSQGSRQRSRSRSRNKTNPPRVEEAKYLSNAPEAKNRHERRADSTDRSRQRSRSRSMDRTPVSQGVTINHDARKSRSNERYRRRSTSRNRTPESRQNSPSGYRSEHSPSPLKPIAQSSPRADEANDLDKNRQQVEQGKNRRNDSSVDGIRQRSRSRSGTQEEMDFQCSPIYDEWSDGEALQDDNVQTDSNKAVSVDKLQVLNPSINQNRHERRLSGSNENTSLSQDECSERESLPVDNVKTAKKKAGVNKGRVLTRSRKRQHPRSKESSDGTCCPYCFVTLKDTVTLVAHCEENHGNNNFCCHLCEYTTQQRTEIKDHIVQVHQAAQISGDNEEIPLHPLEALFQKDKSVSLAKFRQAVQQKSLREVEVLGNGFCFVSSLLIVLAEHGIHKDFGLLSLDIMGEVDRMFSRYIDQTSSSLGERDNFIRECSSFFQSGNYTNEHADYCVQSAANALGVNVLTFIRTGQRVRLEKTPCTNFKSKVTIALVFIDRKNCKSNTDCHYNAIVKEKYYKENTLAIESRMVRAPPCNDSLRSDAVRLSTDTTQESIDVGRLLRTRTRKMEKQ